MNFFQDKKIAIPGGDGFLGTHLTKRLTELGAIVFVPKHSQGWDFTSPENCERLFTQDSFDIVINCAALQGGIGFYKGREAIVYQDNVLMGMFLMQSAQKARVSKFVNIVPNCSYPGYTEKEELKEEEYWDGAVHESIFSYGFSRKTSVAYGATLWRQYGFNSIHLVLANMFGPGEHFKPDQSKALAGLMKKMYDAKQQNLSSIEIWGSGKPLRDWLYVQDGVTGILKAAEIYDSIEPLNIATGRGISVTDLAMVIKEVSGFSGEFVYNTSKPDGAMKKISSVGKMQQILNWVPETPLKQAIAETYAWLEQNYETAITR